MNRMLAPSKPTVKNALAWSSVSNLVMRLGTLSMGIVLARILSPEEFGVYAIALTVQTALMTLADFGMSADLIRCEDPEKRAPTVATLGLITGLTFAASMAVSSRAVANSLGSPEAVDVIFILSFTLLLSGVGIVPFAKLQRNLEQKKLFLVSMVDFVVNTVSTLVMLNLGMGVISLAYSRILAQSCALVLQYVLARQKVKFGIDRSLVGPVLRFGIPVAAANLLSWSLLSVDNVVIAHWAGPLALGFYVLAFNISNWPMSALGQVIRSVTLPVFSRSSASRDSENLAAALALTWGVGLPAGLFLAVLAKPLIVFVYGEKWGAAGPVLAALGLFGALRLLFDVVASFLLARGKSGQVLTVQIVWFAALIPAMIVGTHSYGIVGGGWAHVVVGIVVVLPAYLIALRSVRVRYAVLWGAIWPPLLAAFPAGLAGYFVAGMFHYPVVSLIAGGLAGGGLYA
ncbi:MAG: lipopolysaccharide biosynthesis protein, partial [Specibacter sp.]